MNHLDNPVFFEPLGDARSKKPILSLRKIILFTSGTALTLILLFLFTARSLTLVVVAEGDFNYSLDGFHWPFGERLLIQPGEYQLTVSAEGYRKFENKVVVSKAAAQKLEVRLAPLPGSLKLITNPSRYTSRASEVFKKNILPQFASLESPLRQA